jgi:hypothetical protein
MSGPVLPTLIANLGWAAGAALPYPSPLLQRTGKFMRM